MKSSNQLGSRFRLGWILIPSLIVVAFWVSQQRWFPHKEDHFGNRQIAAIWIMKTGPDGQFEIDKKITDSTKIAWFRSRLDQGYTTIFSGFFGILGPAEFFVDEKGDVIAAAYYRIPEYRVCFGDVSKKDNKYFVAKWEDEYGIRDKAYIHEMAKISNFEIPPEDR